MKILKFISESLKLFGDRTSTLLNRSNLDPFKRFANILDHSRLFEWLSHDHSWVSSSYLTIESYKSENQKH